MQALGSFFLDHWIASLLFILLLISIIINEIRQNRRGISAISPEKTIHFFNHEEGLILDIREATLFSAHHILGAINLPATELKDKTKKLTKYQKKPIVLIGTQHKEIVEAGLYLKEQGFQQVMQLEGGLNGWKRAGFPIASN